MIVGDAGDSENVCLSAGAHRRRQNFSQATSSAVLFAGARRAGAGRAGTGAAASRQNTATDWASMLACSCIACAAVEVCSTSAAYQGYLCAKVMPASAVAEVVCRA